MAASSSRGRELVYRSGRVLDRRLFARLFQGADAEGVVAAVLAYRNEDGDESYGLSPTKFPREWFEDDLYKAHLERLESEQQEDGGWPIAWEPPGPASTAAWRAIVTIDALRTLEENGRLER